MTNFGVCNKLINRRITSEFFLCYAIFTSVKSKKKTFAHRTLGESVNTNRNPRVIDSTF